MRDPQIINGGQTTASLANAIIKKEKMADDMQNLFVPMKLTVLNIENEMSEDEVEPTMISRRRFLNVLIAKMQYPTQTSFLIIHSM